MGSNKYGFGPVRTKPSVQSIPNRPEPVWYIKGTKKGRAK